MLYIQRSTASLFVEHTFKQINTQTHTFIHKIAIEKSISYYYQQKKNIAQNHSFHQTLSGFNAGVQDFEVTLQWLIQSDVRLNGHTFHTRINEKLRAMKLFLFIVSILCEQFSTLRQMLSR